jgi:type II secretory pathway component GspD/PulD (secretin)
MMFSSFLRIMLLLLLSVLSLIAAPIERAGAGNTLEIYKLKFSETGPVLDTLKDIYSNDPAVRMTAAAGKLFIRASAAQHAEISSLINELDIRRKNVRIDVEFVGNGRQSDHGAAVQTRGGVIYNSKSGVSGNISLKPSLYNTTTTISSSTKQILMTMSGSRASLRIGERVPYLSWVMDYGYRYGLITSNIEWQDVGSFLSVEPTIIGDGPMIRVRLVPELSGLVEGRPRQIRFVQAATEVTVHDGRSVQIGGANKSSEFLSKFLIGFDRQGNSSTLSIVLTPRIMDGTVSSYKDEMINDVPRRPKGW